VSFDTVVYQYITFVSTTPHLFVVMKNDYTVLATTANADTVAVTVAEDYLTYYFNYGNTTLVTVKLADFNLLVSYSAASENYNVTILSMTTQNNFLSVYYVADDKEHTLTFVITASDTTNVLFSYTFTKYNSSATLITVIDLSKKYAYITITVLDVFSTYTVISNTTYTIYTRTYYKTFTPLSVTYTPDKDIISGVEGIPFIGKLLIIITVVGLIGVGYFFSASWALIATAFIFAIAVAIGIIPAEEGGAITAAAVVFAITSRLFENK
jgi:hypothetical protein